MAASTLNISLRNITGVMMQRAVPVNVGLRICAGCAAISHGNKKIEQVPKTGLKRYRDW